MKISHSKLNKVLSSHLTKYKLLLQQLPLCEDLLKRDPRVVC